MNLKHFLVGAPQVDMDSGLNIHSAVFKHPHGSVFIIINTSLDTHL